MSVLFSEEQKKFLRQEFTFKGRIMFPNLLTLRKKEAPEDREVYDVQFIFKPEENAQSIASINQFVQQANQIAHNGVNPAVLIPFIKAAKVAGYPEYLKQNGQPNADYLAGHLWVNASTGKDIPPGVFKQVPGLGMQRLTEVDVAETYSGRNAVLCVTLWPMLPKPGQKSQKRGYYVNVRAVLLLDGGDQIGGGVQVNPDQVFGAFALDMGMPQLAAPQAQPQAQPQQWAQPQAQPQQWAQPVPAPIQQAPMATAPQAQPQQWAQPEPVTTQPAWPPQPNFNPNY